MNLDQLKQQAHSLASNGDYNAAIRRYNIIGRHLKDDKEQHATWLATLAGYEFMDNNPKEALVLIQEFGRKYPESPRIADMIHLAHLLGQKFTASTESTYEVLFRTSKAISCFEFVNRHDPYGLAAAEGQLSIATLKMRSGQWGESIVHLKDVLRKQPGTGIASRAEVTLGECYLGLQKGARYDTKLLAQAERYLSGYLGNYPDGQERERAQNLLDRVQNRAGRGQLDVARYYCTARKWQAAVDVLDDILKEQKLSSAHSEATTLRENILARL
jgi:outer membrane protein assembly factor BamD (BamD/ComL family)